MRSKDTAKDTPCHLAIIQIHPHSVSAPLHSVHRSLSLRLAPSLIRLVLVLPSVHKLPLVFSALAVPAPVLSCVTSLTQSGPAPFIPCLARAPGVLSLQPVRSGSPNTFSRVSAMLYFLAYVLSNVLIVLFLFFCVMLIMLWALGKQKAAHRNTMRRSLSPGRHHHSAFPPNDENLNHNHHIDDNRVRNHYSHSDGPYTSRATVTPSVAPRRLSFSTATPTMSTRTMHQPFPANTAAAAAAAAATVPPGFSTWGGGNAAPAPATGAAFGAPGFGMSPGFTSANTIIPQSHTTPMQGRRVTFSLTPEQQQNEYDKQASANLARRRAPALLSSNPMAKTTLPGISTATKTKSTDSRDIPLIELFPSSRPAAPNGLGMPPPPPNPAYEHDQYFRQAPPQQDHHRQEPPPQHQSLHQSRPWRSLYDPSDRDRVLGQGEPPVNPFMPTTREMLRDSLDRGDYADHAQSQPQAQPRRRPPPLPILT